MLKLFFPLFICLSLLAGCSTDEPVSSNEETPTLNEVTLAANVAQYVDLYNQYIAKRTSFTSLAKSSANASFVYILDSEASASNGETLLMIGANDGSGTLTVHPKSVEGGGIFQHTNANGDILGSGIWTATELLDHHDYGSSPVLLAIDPVFFADFRAGSADIRVHAVSDEGAEFDGILRIRCNLPGVNTPNSWVEGIRISLQSALNFNKTVVGGGTLFLAL